MLDDILWALGVVVLLAGGGYAVGTVLGIAFT
jgi:hypothetical protein